MCLHAFHTPLALCEKPGFLWLMSLLHRIFFHMTGVGLTTGANEPFAPNAPRWIAVAWVITFRLGPKNRRTEVLVSALC